MNRYLRRLTRLSVIGNRLSGRIKMIIRSYRDLEVWKKSIELVKKIYIVTKGFPKDEIYGLVSQMRRAAVSIPSNIAEGKMRGHTNEFVQFLYIALGSGTELDTQLIIAKEMKYISEEESNIILDEVNHTSRMIRNLIKALKK